MRNDLTPEFLVEMDKNENSPIQLMVFHFPVLGDVYLSDRDMTVDGDTYAGIVEDWGTKSTVGAENAVSSTETITITLWNGGRRPFSYNFLTEDPTDVFVDLYQTYDGLAPEDIAHIGEFVVQPPIEYGEASSLLELELVTTNMRYFGQIGELLTKDQYPKALEADLNKSIDLIIGDAGEVQCLSSNKPPTATLSGSFLQLPTTINTHEDLDEKSFTPFGFLQIDEEILRYSSRGANHFVISLRGQYGSKAIDHSDGAEIIQASDFNGIYPAVVEYIVGQGPLSSISDVRVKGQVPTIPFSILANENPAIIRFNAQPTFIEFSKGARSKDEFFDSFNRDNSALKPEWAYDQDNKSLGAIIKSEDDNTKLSVIQTELVPDDGQIVKIFLLVEHWATKAYVNDQVDVFVDGIIDENNAVLRVGTLNRPNEKDIIDVGGEVDLQHGHDHATGLDHTHENTATTVDLTDPTHPHGLLATYTRKATGTPYASNYTRTSGTGSSFHEMVFDNSNESRIQQTIATFSFTATGSYSNLRARLYIRNGTGDFILTETKYLFPATSGTVTMITGPWSVPYTDGLDFQIRVDWFYSGAHTLTFTDPQIEYLIEEDQTSTSATSITPDTTTGNVEGMNQPVTYVKDSDDVDDLPDGYTADLINILQDNSSRSVVQKFDVTQHLENVDWGWIHDRKVWLQYTGTIDDVEIIVTNISFEIEYRQRQIKTTDDVTCSVVGSIESRPDAVIQYLLTEKAGLPANKLGSVNRNVPILYDDHIMYDEEIWIDEGQVADVPEGALFEEAGSWFSAHNYFIDGVLSGASTIKDAIEKLTFQTHSKLTWQNGFAKLSVMRKNDDWLIAKDVTIDDIQLMSYKVKKSEVFNIQNLINLFYSIDRLSNATGSEQFDATAVERDGTSIDKHGIRTDDNKWLFDLVRIQGMAESIADYYLWLLGETQTYYSLNTYLTNFDIEKEDFITISSFSIDQLTKLPVAVKEIVRTFGSGKIGQINILSLVCQSIRHRFFQEDNEENILITEDIIAALDTDAEIIELIELEEFISTTLGLVFGEDVTLSENFQSEMNYDPHETENVDIEEEISFDIEIELEEEISVTDDADGYLEIPFGGGGFGMIPFGSVAVFKEVPVDHLTVDESFTTEISSTEEEDITIEEGVITSNGFGGTSVLSSGFGVTPFGN